ncbi:MAG TPA: MFS transporter [Thiolapillus brandeum]|uniref:MFS transporter n=1 Tax=Thiolapillus brandeum TaxID=1076588 RepID=A0A7C5MVY0_9GAMM|nr:MFS transporter [Thiolapillus brandeum]
MSAPDSTASLMTRGWQSLQVYRHPRARVMLFLGFSSGLPLLLVFGTLSVWLREAGVERSTIGFISWVALAYGFKWVWSPLVDKLPVPLLTRRLGRRRSWLLLSQLGVMAGLVGMAFSDPAQGLATLVGLAVLVAFASATQDIAIDAFRIESADTRMQGALAATYMVGYRLAMILASAGVLWLADWVAPGEGGYDPHAWSVAYLAMAAAMLVGLVTTLVVDEPAVPPNDSEVEQAGAHRIRRAAWLPRWAADLLEWLWRAVVSPFADFLRRYRWQAVLLLALIASYRISDIVLGVIANVFYIDLGFTKTEIADVTKVFGIVMTLVGAALGGVLVSRFGVMRILFVGGLLAAATNLLFSLLAQAGPDIGLLMLVVAADNLSAGLASAAFVAYLSGLTNVAYSATQYALFSSVMLLFPKFIGGFSGVMVEQLGYPGFFLLTAAMGLPVLLLVALAWRLVPVNGEDRLGS